MSTKTVIKGPRTAKNAKNPKTPAVLSGQNEIINKIYFYDLTRIAMI